MWSECRWCRGGGQRVPLGCWLSEKWASRRVDPAMERIKPVRDRLAELSCLVAGILRVPNLLTIVPGVGY
jgi:hypothetical protein